MSPAILRIIDANCNRVREALRVLEDYARFARDDAVLSASLKALRHDFQTATAALQRRAVAARDTAGDVGTAITTETEGKRESLTAVVTAAGKRLGEALRTIEEYAKTIPANELDDFSGPSPHGGGWVGAADAETIPPTPVIQSDRVDGHRPPPPNLPRGGRDQSVAAQVESLRYRFYDIEKSILIAFAPNRERMAGVRLHVLITESLCKRPWAEVAAAAIAGGAGVLQLREKELDGGELLIRAKALVAICREGGAIAIINDRPDIALLAGADGVHLGQTDLPIAEARKILGPDAIIGLSTHDFAGARAAVAAGADYIGVGPIFPSTTKPKDRLAGLTYAREASKLPIPTVGISGITAENAAEAATCGLASIAVSSAICAADDPRQAAADLIRALGF